MFSPESRRCSKEVDDEIKRTAGDRWGTCDLVVDQSGRVQIQVLLRSAEAD